MLPVDASFLFIWIAFILGCSIYMLKLRAKTSFFRYRLCGMILLQNIVLSLVLIALARPAVFGVASSNTPNGGLDLVFCDYIYWISYLFTLVPIVLHPLRSWTFYFNYQSSKAKLLASTADPSLFQPMHDIPFLKVDLQWFLLKKKFGNPRYSAIFYAILIGLTATVYIAIRFTTDNWHVSRVSTTPQFCPMLMEIELLAVLAAIGLFMNIVMTALLNKCKENIQLDNETSSINVAVMVVLTVYFLSLFESVCEVADCEEFRRATLIVLAVVYMIGNTLFPLVYYYFKFKKGIADHSALKETLQQVFNNPQLKVQFKEFLVSEFSVENFLFLEAIKKFKKKYEGEVDLNIIRQGVQEVYNEFFKKDAPNALNITHVIYKLLNMKMQDLHKMSAPDMLGLYDEAYSAIAFLVESDSLRRFMTGKDVAPGKSMKNLNNVQGSKSVLKSTPMLAPDNS